MAEQSTRFNEPGSVFAQLNKSGEPETVSLSGVGPTQFSSKMDTTTGINSQTTQAEGMMDASNSEYKTTREKEMVDPNIEANKEVNSNIKNPKPVNFEATSDIEVTNKTTMDPVSNKATVKETSRANDPGKQSWLERQAFKKINNWMTDAGSNAKETEGEEPKNPDTSTQKTKKTSVGMVPALDRNRDKTSVPDISKRPHPATPNISTGPGKTGPKLSVPKFSVPKMKLR